MSAIRSRDGAHAGRATSPDDAGKDRALPPVDDECGEARQPLQLRGSSSVRSAVLSSTTTAGATTSRFRTSRPPVASTGGDGISLPGGRKSREERWLEGSGRIYTPRERQNALELSLAKSADVFGEVQADSEWTSMVATANSIT